ncbi:mobilization protein, partial [Acinetobacter sp. OYA S30]|nr:mobilization protein [Acinetobacter sp. OYA S30]
QQNSQQLQNKQQHKEKTLEQGFNLVEQGFEQWKKAQEVKRLELERKQQLKLQQEQAMKQKHRKSMKRSGPSL